MLLGRDELQPRQQSRQRRGKDHAVSQSLAHPRRAGVGFKHEPAPSHIFISSSTRPRHRRNGPRQAPQANGHEATRWLGVGWETGIAKFAARKRPRWVVSPQAAASGSQAPTEPQTGPPKPLERHPGPWAPTLLLETRGPAQTVEIRWTFPLAGCKPTSPETCSSPASVLPGEIPEGAFLQLSAEGLTHPPTQAIS